MKLKVNEKWLFIGLLIVAIVLIFWRINDQFVAFTDELLFEEASFRIAFGSDDLQMSRVNEILIPINEGKVWLEKAPMYFWLTSIIFKLFFSFDRTFSSRTSFNIDQFPIAIKPTSITVLKSMIIM